MDSTIIIVSVSVICISISIIVGVVMYNSSKSKTSSTLPPSTTPPSTPPSRTYTKNVNMDSGGSDIACFQDGSSADFCKAKCDNDITCKGYNYITSGSGWGWGTKSGCCYKTINGPLSSAPGIDFYALN